MKSITSMAISFIMLCLTAFAHAATAPPGQSSITTDYSEPVTVCLNGKVSTGSIDLSMAPVYDWVHAGQQGINLTVSNKTDRNVVIDWDKTFYPRPTGSAVYRDESTPSIEPASGTRYDVVAPQADFSKILWPRSLTPKAGRLENRKLYLTVMTEKGGELQEEILLDASGESRTCSR